MGTTSKILTLLSAPAFPNLLYRCSSSRFLHLSRHVTLSSTNSRRISHSTPRRILPFRSSSRLHSQSSSMNFDVSGTTSFSRGGSPFVSEILKLVEGLSNGKKRPFGNDRESGLGIEEGELLVNREEAGSDFLKAVDVCMKIARDRPDALRFLSRKDLEIIVYNGSPSLFKNGTSSTSRMKLFLNGDESKIFESERARTVDIMRYVLSYAYDSLTISEQPCQNDAKVIDTSFRNIIFQLVNMSGTDALPRRTPVSYEQASRPPMTEVEMKPGDWICGKCSFMNFAKNSRCLECDEVGPKNQFSLSNGEWECPQCDYYNYRRNMSCLRCDCKRPGESPITPTYTKTSTLDQILSGKKPDNYNLEQRLAANDEKAEKWFNKISQMGDKTDLDDSTPDEDFPELMPLRKGSNKFVVSTRKTPLERRLANSQSETSKSSESSISKSLDRILGRNTSASQSESGDHRQSIAKSDPNYVPFVPLSPDLFKEPQNSAKEGIKNDNSVSTSDNNATVHDDDFPEIMPMRKGENRFVVSKKKDRSLISPPYKKRIAMEQANQSDFIPFVPFPPDYFAKKDKQPEPYTNDTTIASENTQTVSSNLDNSRNNISNNTDSYGFSEGEGNYQNTHQNSRNNTKNSWNNENDNKSYESTNTHPTYGSTQEVQKYSSPGSSQGVGKYQNAPQDKSWNSSNANMSYTSKSTSASYDTIERVRKYQNIPQDNSWNSSNPNNTSYTSRNTSASYDANEGIGKCQSTPHDKSWNSSNSNASYTSKNTSFTYDSNQGVGKYQSASQGSIQGTKSSYSFTGKSLEGSAVTDDPDPLDMSEEAKAARWFRRAAQIKNISELSEIPDEDFPEIMPMRKGVNRFVVSKRKTPLERRLTSPQYRRNLPIVSSEPEKDSK